MEKYNKPTPGGGCPGSAMRQWAEENDPMKTSKSTQQNFSQLRQWPVQLTLVPAKAPYFQNADLVIVADCVPLAYGNFHEDFLKGRPVVIGCPKLDDLQHYVDKLTEIFKSNEIKSVDVLLMEVPCCGGIVQAARIAREEAGRDFPLKITTIGVRGEHFGSQDL